MQRKLFGFLAATAMVGAAACAPQTTSSGAPAAAAPAPPAAPAPAPAAPAGGAVSVYSGVYSAAQATRGNQTQQRECSTCHSTADWSQGRLLSSWRGRPAFELVEHLRQTMPMDSPGRLSMQQYTDIFAYMLQLNGIPAGNQELPATEEALRRVTIEYRS